MRTLLFSAMLLGLAGCDSAEGGYLVRVNGAEIRATHVRADANLAQALEKVIERELLVQKALDAGLERDQQVKERIDEARREVLAQAWIEHRAAALPPVGREEVRAFYAENPALFAERRIYRTRELAVSAPGEMLGLLRAEAARVAADGREIDDIAAWLKARNVRFSAIAQTQSAEQMPLAFLPHVVRMKAGDIAVFPTPLGANVVQLLHAEEAPLSEAQAAPLIGQFLAGRRRLELAAAEVRELRQAARIEYAADFQEANPLRAKR